MSDWKQQYEDQIHCLAFTCQMLQKVNKKARDKCHKGTTTGRKKKPNKKPQAKNDNKEK